MNSTFNGMMVSQSHLAMTETPVKEHVKTRSMSDTYHKRVQKKWNKRYGMKYVPGAFQVGNRVIVHPSFYEQLKEYI